LVKDIEAARAFVRERIDEFLRDHYPEQADGKIRPVARRFALPFAPSSVSYLLRSQLTAP
jgi:hypothetical protein